MQADFTIILSRTDSIGDVVLTLPMAGVLKKNYPRCKIIFLGRTYTKDVIELSEHVDQFLNYDDLEKLSVSDRVSMLRELKADIFLHVLPVKAIATLAKKARIKLRVGTTNRIYHWWTCNKLIKLSRKNSTLHESQLNMQLLRLLDIPVDLSLEEVNKAYGFSKLQPLQPVHQSLLGPGKINVLLHPKSKGSAREWGPGNFSKLVQMLPDEKFKVFIGGTKEDGDQLADFLRSNPGVTDLTGKLSLQQYIAFISHCDALVAASTGPLHIAAALGRKAIGLFSSRRPIHPGRWAPVGINAHVVVFEENCPNCAAGKDCDCIRRISPQRILKLLEA